MRSGDGWTRRSGRSVPGSSTTAPPMRRGRHGRRRGTRTAERERLATEAAQRPVLVRDLARGWLAWQRDVKQIKPSTLRDYEALLREPGTPFKRGQRASAGRILAALGDEPIASVRTRDVSTFLRSLEAEGPTPRNVNKHRQVLAAMFQYACREDAYDLPANPVLGTDKRLKAPPAALDYYEPHEIGHVARVTAAGKHRRRSRHELDRRTDEQDGELFRLLFFTGLRLGEAVTLRWDDVDLELRTVLVRRGLSADVEGVPKGPPLPCRPARRAGCPSAPASSPPWRVRRPRRLRLRQRVGETSRRLSRPPALQGRQRPLAFAGVRGIKPCTPRLTIDSICTWCQ